MTDRTETRALLPYADPDHDGNSAKYHTGKTCIEAGCDKPAGTLWGPHWCFECSVRRIDRIDEGFKEITAQMEARA